MPQPINVVVVDRIDGHYINRSLHLDTLADMLNSNGKVKLSFADVTSDALEDHADALSQKADVVIVVHDFSLWRGKFLTFISRLTCKSMVLPTELFSIEELQQAFTPILEKTDKLVLGSDSFYKIFSKIFPNNDKIKLIYIPPAHPNPPARPPFQGKASQLVLTPGVLSPEKDFVTMLDVVSKLHLKHPTFKYVLALRPDENDDPIASGASLERIYKAMSSRQMDSYTRVFFKELPRDSYRFYIENADLIALPVEYSQDVYRGTLVDAIAANRPVVAPYTATTQHTNHAMEFAKKGGVLLYHDDNETTMYDAMNILLDNPWFGKVIEEESAQVEKNFIPQKIAQQYVNTIKRL